MADCVGCGYCCIKVPCGVAQRLHGGGLTECPHLSWNGSRYICGLMIGTGPIVERYREELAAGAGCCSGLNDWRQDVKPRRKRDEQTAVRTNPVPWELQMFANCLGHAFISSDAITMALLRMKSKLIEMEWDADAAGEFVAMVYRSFKENRGGTIAGFME